MIEPGKNGRRSGSVAKGRCEAGCFAKSGRPLARWILNNETGVREARWGRLRDPDTAADDAVAAHLCARFVEPVQTDLANRGWRWDGGGRCRAVHALRKPERPTIPPAPMPMDTGTAFALWWINLPTLLLRRFASFARAAFHPSVTRRATSYGSHSQSVSNQPRGDEGRRCRFASTLGSTRGRPHLHPSRFERLRAVGRRPRWTPPSSCSRTSMRER